MDGLAKDLAKTFLEISNDPKRPTSRQYEDLAGILEELMARQVSSVLSWPMRMTFSN